MDVSLEDLGFEVDGVGLHAVAAGRADRPVVLLLHGFPEDLDDHRRVWSMPGALRGMIHGYRAAFRFPPPSRIPADWKVSVPVLILWGEDDRFLETAMARESLAFCTGGRCVTLPGISHWIQHEAPERVTAELLADFAARRP